MGVISDKLAYLAATKTAIKNAIIAKGVDVDGAVAFRQYADKIGEIEGGGIPEELIYSIVDEGVTSIPTMSTSIGWFMSKVYVPPSVTEIGNYFVTKSEITEVLGGVNILTFGTNAFNGCTLMTTINLPSVTQFGNNAFNGCTLMTTIDLGSRNNVLAIGGATYLQSDNLTVSSFLQIGNALIDNTGSTAKTIHVKSVAWGRLSTTQKEIFTNKNYTISVS